VAALDRASERYRIRIDAHLDASWSAWFDGLTITQHDDGTSSLVGELVDQAALYGLLGRLRDLGASLLSVQRLGVDGHVHPVTHESGDPR
jgi:hypothetical protein